MHKNLNILPKLRNSLLAIILIFVAPFLFILVTPIYIFRKIVFYIAPIVRPDLGKMLTTRSTIFAADDIFTKPGNNAVVSGTISQNYISVKKIREEFRSRTLLAGTPKGLLKYPELQATLIYWLGFAFWKPDPEFNLDDHIRLHPKSTTGAITSSKDGMEILREIVNKPWAPGKCLWDMQILWNCKSESSDELKTMVIFKFHHSMSDAFSFIKMATNGAPTNEFNTVAKPGKVKISTLHKLLTCVFFFLKVPYDFIKFMLLNDQNEWHKKENIDSEYEMNGIFSEPVSVNFIKEIRKRHGVSFTVVLRAAFTAAIRDTMIRQGVKVPNRVHCLTPFPFPGHPNKLRNHL